MNISIRNPYAKSGITTAISALSFVVWAGSVTNYQNVAVAELGASESWVDVNGENPETANRNVKTDAPFALPEWASELPLTLHTNGVAVARAFSVGVLTVSPDAAKDVRDMLPDFPNPFHGYRMEPTEATDAETGDVTFGLAFIKRGLTISIM